MMSIVNSMFIIFQIFKKLSTGIFFKLIIQKLHGIYLFIFVFINLICIALYMKIENIKINVIHGIQKKLKKM